MDRLVPATLGALALLVTAGAWAAPDREVIVLDAPDVQRLPSDAHGARMTDLVGTDVFSNAGERLGEIEDFIFARGGYLYAVVDTADGFLEDTLELKDGELVVVPWDQLRLAAMPE